MGRPKTFVLEARALPLLLAASPTDSIVRLMWLDLILVNGGRRALELPSGSGTVANALARLDDWIETSDGGWVQKSFIVEVRVRGEEQAAGTEAEYAAIDAAAGELAQRTSRDR